MEEDVSLNENSISTTSTPNEQINKSLHTQNNVMEFASNTHCEEEEDPLALDDLTISSNRLLESPPKLAKHSHCLRRQTPRLATKSSSEKSTPSPEKTSKTSKSSSAQASTMREVLASIPGFGSKPRRRSNKKMSTAAQIEQTKDGKIDLETPDSILVGTNLRALLNTHTFCLLPPLFKQNLVQLLPIVDRPLTGEDPAEIRLNPSGLNNEFFARACLEWRERLAEGEFTPENQVRLKTEAEKEKNKLDPWKLKHFEPIWGSKQDKASLKAIIKLNALENEAETSTSVASTSCSSTVGSPLKQGPSEVMAASHGSTSNSPKRIRTVGAMTRAQQSLVSSSEPTESFQISPTKKDIREADSAENQSRDMTIKDDKKGKQLFMECFANSKNDIKVPKVECEEEPTLIFEIEVNSLNLEGSAQDADEIIKRQQEIPTVPEGEEKMNSSKHEIDIYSKDETDSSDAKEPVSSITACDSADVSREASSTNEEIDNKNKCTVLQDTDIVSESSDYSQQRSEPHSHHVQPSEATNNDHLISDVYKMHNFNGLLQSAFNIQDSTLMKDSSGSNQNILASAPLSSKISDNFDVNDLGNPQTSKGKIQPCSEETTSSTSGLVDCSGENTAIDEIEPSIQKLLPIEDDPIEQKFADAENFLLESEANEDFTGLHKRSAKRSSSPEYNERKQLRFNEKMEGQPCQATDNSTTNSDDFKEDNKLVMDMRYSDTDNADTLDEKTCTSDIDVKLGLDSQMLYSHENDIEKIDPHDLIPSDYSHNSLNDRNEMNAPPFSEVTSEHNAPENLFTDMYKLQNFNGLLQNAFNIQNSFPHNVQRCADYQPGVGPSHQMPTSSSSENVENFTVSDLTNSSGTGCMGTNMLTCSEETNSSTSGLVDCSGDNSADDNAIAEVETNSRNIEDDPIDLKFEDAEQYVLESGGEISTDSGEASSLVALTTSQSIKNEDNAYMESITQANVITTASSAAGLALVGNESMEISMSDGYGSLQQMDKNQQHQQFVSSGTTSSYSSPIVSASSSSSCSSVSGPAVPGSSEMLSKDEIYQHVAHDWNFGIKMESHENAETNDELSISEGQQQQMETIGNTDIANHTDNNNAILNSDGSYPSPVYNATCQEIKNDDNTPAGEMEVTSTVTSNSNDSSSDQSLNSDVGHSSKTTSQSMDGFIIHQSNEPSNVAFEQHQLQQELKNSSSNNEMISNRNELYLDQQSSHIAQSFQHSQQNLQPHFNFQSNQQRPHITQPYIDNQAHQQSQFHHPAQNNVQMSIGSMQRPHQAIQSTSLTKAPFNKISSNNGNSQQQQPQRSPQAFMSLSTSQPLKVIPNVTNNSIIPTTIAQQRPKLQPSSKGRRSSNKLPPGAVNLERSYQICQAVIQNSPNRHQLTAQLRPPPSMLAANTNSTSSTSTTTNTLVTATASKKDMPGVSSSNRQVYKMVGPRLGYPKRKFVQRQPSPTSVIRHVYPSSPIGPGSAVHPGMPMPMQQQHAGQMQSIGQTQPHQQGYPTQQQQQMIQGQYVLIHRANVGAADNQAPRASSAPPAQNQQIHGVNGVPISGRGRPASVDVESQNSMHEMHPVVPGIARRTIGNQGIPYNENTVVDNNSQNYVGSANDNLPSNCACSLNPMVICVQCGAFCHDDCISPAKLCISCVIR